mgnify:CR=1 FL=1
MGLRDNKIEKIIFVVVERKTFCCEEAKKGKKRGEGEEGEK